MPCWSTWTSTGGHRLLPPESMMDTPATTSRWMSNGLWPTWWTPTPTVSCTSPNISPIKFKRGQEHHLGAGYWVKSGPRSSSSTSGDTYMNDPTSGPSTPKPRTGDRAGYPHRLLLGAAGQEQATPAPAVDTWPRLPRPQAGRLPWATPTATTQHGAMHPNVYPACRAHPWPLRPRKFAKSWRGHALRGRTASSGCDYAASAQIKAGCRACGSSSSPRTCGGLRYRPHRCGPCQDLGLNLAGLLGSTHQEEIKQ